jgi:AcrR family transcriptional regulator
MLYGFPHRDAPRAMQENPDSAVPPKPRKLPKQGRSRMLVESTKQACLQILQREGPRALTATRIAEVSGVAMGSIYQYFPNVEAIVATVYEDLTQQEVDIAHRKWATDWATLPLEQALLGLIRGSIHFHRKMLALDPDFHRRFYLNFDLEKWFNESSGEPEAAVLRLQELLERHHHRLPSGNTGIQAFIINSNIRSVILGMVRYHPEYLERPELATYLLRLCLAVAGVSPESLQVEETGDD